MKTFTRFVSGAFIGSLIGAALALLFTPKSGQELQEDLKARVQNLQAEIQNAAHERRLELEKQLQELRQAIPRQQDIPIEE